MSDPKLPRLPLRFLRWFCKDQLIDEIEGDLLEVYHQRYHNRPFTAKYKFYKEVLQSFNKRNIGLMEKYRHTLVGASWTIVRQYTIILFRKMKRSKVYTAISILSLILGLTCAGLISLYLKKELTYDRIYTQSQNIYRINHHSNNSGRSYGFAPIAMVPHLLENVSGVEDGTRIFKYRRAIPMTVESTDRSFDESKFGWVDPSFFKIFDLQLIHGSREKMLDRPNVVVISEKTAKKYFGEKDPIGQVIIFNWSEETRLEIVGVFKDPPSNTSFQLDLVSNIETCKRTMWSGGWLREWQNMFTSAYVLLQPGTEDFVEKEAQKAISANYYPDRPNNWSTSLQRLTDIHLETPMDVGEWSTHNDMQTVILFGAIGIIILSIGCFNFINMVTAQAGQRTKEVGVRKVLGSHKIQIAQQSLFETFCYVLLAGILSWIMMYCMLPIIGTLTAHQYVLTDIMGFSFLGSFFMALVIIAIVAGAYPSLYISRVHSLQLMKKATAHTRSFNVRNVLVISQFAITIGLIVCTLMVYLQLRYINNKALGFDHSLIATIPIHNDNAVIPKINTYRDAVTTYPGISNVTAASHEMLSDYTYITNFEIEGFNDPFKWERYTVDHQYLKTFDLEIIAGRDFNAEIASDSSAFVLNESAVEAMGITPEQALELEIMDEGLNYTGKIIGVVKDFHFRSLHHTIQPFVMYVNWDRLDYISVKLNSRNLSENIEVLQARWYETYGDSVPFFCTLLDDQVVGLYQSENNEMQLFSLFCIISIILGVLGLFGSALFNAERMFKEIGVRKVLGAGFWQLIFMINNKFIKLVLISFVVATPIAFILIGKWLEDFAYRIDQPFWVYILTGLVITVIASMTVSSMSWKAASSNPIDAIKVE